MSIEFDPEVANALDRLTASARVIGPIHTDTHTTYVLKGLADTDEQITDLCWCILGFLAGAFLRDLSIDSAIGHGEQARANLSQILKKRVRVGEALTDKQKADSRNPLLHELISHTLLAIHRKKSILPEWLAKVQACRPPHVSANDSGPDLIAIGAEDDTPFPIIGEAKAYEKDPLRGLGDACEKFTQVRIGEYNDELRTALRDLPSAVPFSKEELAASIWKDIGRFGALVGHDRSFGFDIDAPCTKSEVLKQDPKRLFFIASPYNSMRGLFDELADRLSDLAESLGNSDA